MDIDPATHADFAPVSFLDKFATIFTRADREQADATEERVLTFFRGLSEREPHIRNVDIPAKTVGWSEEPQTIEGLKVQLKGVDIVGQDENTKTISNEMKSREGLLDSQGSSARPGQPKPNLNVKLPPAMSSERSDGSELANKKMAGKMEDTAESSKEQQSKSPSTVGDRPLKPDLAVKKPHERHEKYFETNDQAQLCPEVKQEFVSGRVKESNELGEFKDIRENQTSLNMESQDQSTDQSQKNISGRNESIDAISDKLSGSSPDQHMFTGTCNEVISPERNTEDGVAHMEERSISNNNASLLCVNHVILAENTHQHEPTKNGKPGEPPYISTPCPLLKGKNDKASAESQESFSDLRQTSAQHQDSSIVNTEQSVTMSNITEEDNAISPVMDVQMDVESKEEACLKSPERLNKHKQGLSTDVSACTSESTDHLSPASERPAASNNDMDCQQARTVVITMTQEEHSSISGTGDCPNGDGSVASHTAAADANTRADGDSTRSGSGRRPPLQQESSSFKSEKQDTEKDKVSEDGGRKKESVAEVGLSSPVGHPRSPTTEAASPPPAPPAEKPTQLQFLFTGLLKRGSSTGENENEAADKPLVPEQRAKPLRRGLFPEQTSTRLSPTRGPGEPKAGFLEQLSLLLNLETNKVEEKTEERREMEGQQAEQLPDGSGKEEFKQEEEKEKKEKKEDTEKEGEEEGEESEKMEKVESLPDCKPAEETKKPTGTELAFDAFKAFFTPKPMKKPTIDRADLEAVKRKIRSDKEMLKAFFERNSTKTDKTTPKSESSSPAESEERTPRRLQAIWPPPKPKDEVGLKYTEAEHQAALLQLKRECKEEVEKLQSDFELQLFRVRGENAENVSRLEDALAQLQRDKDKAAHGNRRDACVSTEDDLIPRTFRTVCIQTDRETFIRPSEDEECRSISQGTSHSIPKKLNLASLNLGLTGKTEQAPAQGPPRPPPPPLQSDCLIASSSPVSPGDMVLTPPPPAPPLPGSLTSTSCSQAPGGPPIPPPPPPPVPLCGPPPAPPPPPQGSSLLPPPPPPGVGFALGSSLEKPPRKPALEPSCPMKPLYWTRIQIQDNTQGTLWSSLEEPHIVNPHEFEDLFAKASLQTKRKPLSEAYEKRNKAKKIIKLLDSKRSQAVGIFISSLHLEMKDIKQAVLTVDNTVVDLETIEALYENRAQPGELERIKTHYETLNEEQIKLLDKPEQFLYELSQIPDFSGRARCLIFQSVFTDSVASIRRKVEIVSRVCKGLLERMSVREVMGLILALGNYMNGGSRIRGQADGFGLEILPKLKDVKSRDNRISLVDYVVSYYLRNFDEHAGTDKSVFPLPEPQDIFLAAQVKFEDLFKDVRKLGKDLSVCEQDVQRVCASSSEEHLHPFKEKMESFIVNAQQEHSATEHQLMCAQKSFHDLVVYFGVKPKSGDGEVMPGQVFMLWFEFCGDFKMRWKRESKNISRERLREAQQCVKNITGEKKVETRKVHANSLKERLRQKEASLSAS